MTLGRKLAAAFVFSLVVAASMQAAATQDYPTRPVTMVVPVPPGGGTDVLGRIVGKRLSEVLGQQVVIENVGGAGGMIGSNRVVHAPADGYQFVLGSRADAINQTLYKHPLYNLRTDLTPVILIADQPMILIARKGLPVDGLQQFIAYVRKNQTKVHSGSAGIGSTGYVDCALFNQAIGVKVQDIPYRGGRPGAGRSDWPAIRLFLHAEPDGRAAGEGGSGQADRHAEPQAAAVTAGPAHHLRAGPELRSIDLVRLFPAQGYAARDRQKTA
jgi:tripartite-type tricarboxylate transporter receptor subunit TctC